MPMHNLNPKHELLMKLNTEELTPTQIRLCKSLHSLMASVLTAEDESEFFEMSAELMKRTAELIKHAAFSEKNQHINYGEQAVEFAVDFLNENLDQNKLGNIDN
jgi:hypothetical protein